MNLHTIAEIVNNNDIVIGVRVIDLDTGKISNISIADAERHKVNYCRNKKAKYTKLKGNEFYKEGGLVVLRKNNELIEVSNWKGQVLRGKISDALPALNNFGIANGFIRDNRDVVMYSVENGAETSVKSVSVAPVKNIVKSEVKRPIEKSVDNSEEKKRNSKRLKSALNFNRRLCINGSVGDKKYSSSIMCDMDGVEVTLEQKMVKAQLELQRIAPFMSSMLATTNVVESYEIDTAGVSVDTMYFNPDYMKDLSLNHIKFIYMHELSHLLMQHRARQKNREHEKWNIACDAYINKMLSEDFGNVFSSEDMKKHGYVFIDDVDIKEDIPEKIYEGLKDKDKQSGDGNGQSSNENGSQENGDGQGQGGSGQKNNEQNDERQNGSGNSQQDDNSSDNESQGSSSNENGDNTGDGEGTGNGSKKNKKQGNKKEYKYKGKDVSGTSSDNIGNDMIDDEKSQSMSEETLKQRAKAIVERAKVYNDTMGSKKTGSGEGSLMREVEKALAPKVDWVPLVRNKLTKASQKALSFSSPDKRFLSRNMILPGPKSLIDDSLENVIIAIDTSGSISNKELGIFFKQFELLMRRFKVSGEVIYWGSNIEAIYPFKNWKELVSTKPIGGGGTEINCVFEYLEGRDFKIGKKKKPSIILVATDGYFGTVNKKYYKWTNETIWVISPESYERFNEPFGKKAVLKGEENER